MRLTNRKLVQAMSVAGVLAAAGLAGCDNDLTESPPHTLTADNLFTSAAGFEGALNALHAGVRHPINLENSHWHWFWQSGTDNVFSSWENDGVGRAMAAWETPIFSSMLTPSHGSLHSMWAWLYAQVNGANTIIGRAEDETAGLTEAQKNAFQAEARFFRAWAYRSLTYFWGDVPLSLDESTELKLDWARAPVSDVLAQMETDLLAAIPHLPPTSPNGSGITSALARHHLAELYLRMGRNAEAEETAEAVINSGDYSLITERYGVNAGEGGTPFTDMFLDGNILRSQGNTEILWALEIEKNVTGGGGSGMRRAYNTRYYQFPGIAINEEHGGRGQQRGSPTNFAWSLYEDQDDRWSVYAVRKFYIYSDPSILPAGKELGDTLWLQLDPLKPDAMHDHTRLTTRKWDYGDPNAILVNLSYADHPYVRLAETILLAAEAEVQQGKMAEAADHINMIRRRSNATEATPSEMSIDYILDERSRELLTETERRFHLLRMGKWLERSRMHNIHGVNMEDHHVLFPIPQPVIDANLDADFPQNPGYVE